MKKIFFRQENWIIGIGIIFVIITATYIWSISCQSTVNKNYITFPVNVDATIVGIRETKGLYMHMSNSITFIKDTHGHIGHIIGNYGELGDVIEVQCTNGFVRGY